MKIGSTRLFGRSDHGTTKFEFLTRSDIDDVADPGNIYLTRWHIIKTPWGGLYLHAIRRPDADRCLHDHPWTFATLVLHGGYIEETLKGKISRGIGSLRVIHLKEYHRIDALYRTPTWTLVAVGPKRRDWGFLTSRGWVKWDEYLYSGEFVDSDGRVRT